ncbi:hypothetical protein AGDE_14701 [Angomonas deanei]|nr:hypothetical protein AGDE_14701 [Angomonas deanei]|eukprot:EPY20397.1 hypothetical protein AGDE_14701 [Angomonas deanei]
MTAEETGETNSVLNSAYPPLISFGLARTDNNTLSEEKLGELDTVLSGLHGIKSTRVESLTVKQCRSIVHLFSALYGLPDADESFEPSRESGYLRQLRRQNLSKWLTEELHSFVHADLGEGASRAEQLVQYILSRKLRDAEQLAEDMQERDIAAIIRICGRGNQFGSYVTLAKNGFEGAEVRDRLVALLSRGGGFVHDGARVQRKRKPLNPPTTSPPRGSNYWAYLLFTAVPLTHQRRTLSTIFLIGSKSRRKACARNCRPTRRN